MTPTAQNERPATVHTFDPHAPAAMSDAEFGHFAKLVTSKLGIKMPATKKFMLQSRLRRRMRQLDIDTIGRYQEYLFRSPDSAQELVHFINAVTTNKTDFFREAHHMHALPERVLPVLWRERGARGLQFKLWCAGCSSGEEPYTLAMVLSEFAGAHPGFAYSILATDISTKVLGEAEQGIYDESKIAPVPVELRRKYLLRSRNPDRPLVRISPELRSKIRFRRLNFMDADYHLRETFDAIFFRNVMIYFDRPTQETVLTKLVRQLKPGGHLFVGHSESLAGMNLPLQAVSTAIHQKTTQTTW